VSPRDWLLLLVAADGAPDGLDPIRLQKGMFLLAQEGGVPPRERYAFRPYNYGPMSPRLYRDLDGLVRRGLVERRPVPGYAWSRFAVTPRGAARAAELRESADRAASARLESIKSAIVRLGFAELLAMVYERYPAYASRSVFRRP
jgi:hypothetical protein